MIPFVVLVITTVTARLLGAVGVGTFESWQSSARLGLALMLVLTATAHFSRRRPDMVAMVPRRLPARELLVTLTGALELLIAVGLLLPTSASVAAITLALLLIVMFPANIRAARAGLTIGGKPATALGLRTALQAVFVTAAFIVA